MRREKLVILMIIGLLPLLSVSAAWAQAGAEIAFNAPVKFQADPCDANAAFWDVVAGDVDGDGDQDLIVIKFVPGGDPGCGYKGTAGGTEPSNDIRIYFNQLMELGGPAANPSIDQLFYPPPGTAFPTSDGTGGGKMAVIYEEGWMLKHSTWDTEFPNPPYTPYYPGHGRNSGCNSLVPFNPNNPTSNGNLQDNRPPFVDLALSFKMVGGRKVVDQIVAARMDPGEGYGFPGPCPKSDNQLNTAYGVIPGTWGPRWMRYAGRMVHLKNPYVVSGNPADAHRPWLRKDATDITQIHPGHQANFYYNHCWPQTPFVGLNCVETTHDYYTDDAFKAGNLDGKHSRQFYNDDYAFKARNWNHPPNGYEFWGSFNQIEMGDLNGDGYYDLYGAPRSPSNYGLNQKAVIYRYEHPKNASNDYNTDYQDGLYPDNKYTQNKEWEDGINKVITTQCINFRLVDMDKDGIPDILCGQGSDLNYQTGVPISWIKGNSTGTFANQKTEDYQVGLGVVTFSDLWAGNLRGKPGEWPADNPKGSPDLIIARTAEPKIDVSLYVDTTKAGVAPKASTYSNWKTVYKVPDGDYAPMMGNFFKRVITADVDGDGYEDLIALTGGNIYANKGGRAAFWIFKKDTTLYLTQRVE